MKIKNIKKIDKKYLQCDITTPTENFFIFDESGLGYLIHNSPAIYFGRDEQGNFVLTDKSGFTAKGYDGKPKSAQDLKTMLLNRSRAVDDSRQQFAGNMARLFDQLEKTVDQQFRGFIFADVLFFQQPAVNKQNEYEFTPNTVTYHISQNSDLGKQIGRSSAGIVMHHYNGDPVTDIPKGVDPNKGVLLIAQVTATGTAEVDTQAVDRARQYVEAHSSAIDSLLDDSKLAAAKVSDFKAILYRYVNSQVTTKDFSKLDQRFEDWLASSSVSANKQAKILAFRQENPNGFRAVFETLAMIQQVKDQIISQLDQQNPIKQSINGKPGGEGYVKGQIKLVPRARFTAVNREKHQ